MAPRQQAPQTPTRAVQAASSKRLAPAKAPPRAAVLISSWLRRFFLRCADRMLPAHLAVLEHAHSFAKAHILSTMAELGIADNLSDGPQSAEDIAATIGCQPEAVHRLLRAAAVFNAVRLNDDGRFESTRFTRVLRRDHASAAAYWCRYVGSAPHQAAWADLTGTVRSGSSAFHRVHNQSMFDWLDTHPEEGANFSAGIGGLTLAEAPAIISGYPFPSTGVVCDVGGGQGVLLGQILKARPRIRGILVDSAPVLAQARGYLRGQGLGQRVELAPGNLHSRIDAHADLYLLKWILHDWDDRTCEQIVATVATTMPEGARLVVIEGEQSHDRVDPRFSMIDLAMMTVTEGGRERSRQELMAILTAGGLIPGECRRTSTGLVLLEATKPHSGLAGATANF